MAGEIREHIAAALHDGRDHTRDGVSLGNTPICNCYELADNAIAALGGVKTEREYGTYSEWEDGSLMQIDYAMVNVTPDPRHYIHERIAYASRWTETEIA